MNTGSQSSLDFFRPYLSTNATRTSSPQNHPAAGFDGLIKEAGQRVTEGPLKSYALSRLWNEVAWNKVEDQRIASDAEVARDGSSRIDLYPSLLQKSRQFAVYTLIREFGHLIFNRCNESQKRRWEHKLCLPKQSQIRAVQDKLTTEFKSYHELVASFDRAMDRYVALNLCNALIAHGVPYAQAQNLDFKTWGATQEYASGKRYHVLIPLISAYASKEVFESFGAAMADWLCELNGITESTVAAAAHGIIREIIQSLK